MVGYICVGVLLAVIIIAVICFYNKVIKLKICVDEAFATMDVYLKKRADMIPNLVETVKGFAVHEREIFANADRVISTWNGNEKDRTTRFQSEEDMARTLKDIKFLSERYPQIRANENFLMLQKNLQSVETEIANARKYYNGVVNTYNSSIQTFPANIIAKLLGFKKEKMFMGTEWDRENVRISF